MFTAETVLFTSETPVCRQMVYRRNRGDMIEVYKMISGKYDSTVCDFIKLRSDFTTRDHGRGHSMKIFTQRSRLNARKHSFTVRIANLWNSLPGNVVESGTVNTFKNRLDRHWRGQGVLYDYRAEFETVRTTDLANQESDEEDL